MNLYIPTTMWILVLFQIQSGIYDRQIIAAIKDSGSSCHPHKVIEQKDIQIKDTYVDWSK